jgi:peptidoglycan/xylan/chitin deacetylase (PgdA/CDA1 family)
VTGTDALELEPDHFLRERYLRRRRRSPLLSAYYALKPMIPGGVWLALRRLYARRQAARRFPAWPIEDVLVERQRAEFRQRIRGAGGNPVDFVNFWPDQASFASVLTHDVEGTSGIENIPQLREIERRHGFVSAWYFVAEEYPIPPALFDTLRSEGCEIGLHGIRHDAKLFFNRKSFETELPTIHRYLADWQVVGFRSPATHRNADWMPDLGCLYDTSFSDTAPFEPQPGGCCSIQPYFLDDLVELPMTLTMDHTLWEVLGETSSAHWVAKAQWVIANHGLINLLTHPDYATTGERLACYDEFLAFLASQKGGWHALPRQVAAWWKARAALDVEAVDGEPVDLDGVSGRPTVAYAREIDGTVVFDSGARRT